jgi:hypothetical protein
MPKKRDGIMIVRISTDDKMLLQKIADKADVTLSDAVLWAIRTYMQANPIPGKKVKIS